MNIQLRNLKVAFSDSRNRVMLLVIFSVVITSILMGIYRLRHKVKTVGANANVASAPAVRSVPGTQEPSREYVKLQRQQNREEVRRAQKEGTSAVPTIIRASYIGSDAFSRASAASASDGEEGGDAACDVISLRRARRAGVSAFELRCRGCDPQVLRAAGYTAGELRAAGFTAKALRAAGFNPAELRIAGFNASELRDAGFTVQELGAAGFTAAELRDAGYRPEDFKAQCSLSAIRKLRKQKFPLRILKVRGCSVAALRAAGYTDDELSAAGFSAALINGECDVPLLRGARMQGASVQAMREKGCPDSLLERAGFDLDVNKSGCQPSELMKARSEGVLAKQLKERGCSVASLYAAGYTAGELRDAGFTAEQMKDAGFTAAELREAGFSAADLRAAGLSATELRRAGFSAADLKQAGFTVGELVRAGFGAETLKALGFTADLLRDAGMSAQALRRAGFALDDLVKGGYTRGALIRAGVTPERAEAVAAGAGSASSASGRGAGNTRGGDASGSGAEAQPKTEFGDLIGGNTESADAATALERLERRQAQQISEQARRQQLEDIRQGMATQANDLISSWGPPTAQRYMEGEPPKPPRVPRAAGNGQPVLVSSDQPGAGQGRLTQAGLNQAGGAQPDVQGTKTVFKAGTVMFAVLQTAVNSDEPSPIMASIVSGKLRGAKLIGKFKRVNKRLVLSFNLLSVPGLVRSVSINAVAISQKTARTALADRVNSHYLLRYGSLFAASFVSGLADAISKSGNTSSFSEFGVEVQQEELNNSELALVALGNVGKEYANRLNRNFDRPPTVKLFSGGPLGVLFMQDLAIALPEKTE